MHIAAAQIQLKLWKICFWVYSIRLQYEHCFLSSVETVEEAGGGEYS